jgi:REP element-mobilizing transposase RayT
LCLAELKKTAQLNAFSVLAYCVMPDHLHLLVAGQTDWSKLIRFVQRFKQMTSYYHKKRTGSVLWQSSFWDRALRSNEDLLVVAEYIFRNPVIAGLTENWFDYPFSGGLFFDALVSGGDEAEASSPRWGGRWGGRTVGRSDGATKARVGGTFD